jgi:hypothetical protein
LTAPEDDEWFAEDAAFRFALLPLIAGFGKTFRKSGLLNLPARPVQPATPRSTQSFSSKKSSLNAKNGRSFVFFGWHSLCNLGSSELVLLNLLGNLRAVFAKGFPARSIWRKDFDDE